MREPSRFHRFQNMEKLLITAVFIVLIRKVMVIREGKSMQCNVLTNNCLVC